MEFKPRTRSELHKAINSFESLEVKIFAIAGLKPGIAAWLSHD
ncbi:MAG: hypothetical protein AAGA01_17015 [Cyanobacteria bacterium P01_E01_bin.43]